MAEPEGEAARSGLAEAVRYFRQRPFRRLLEGAASRQVV